MYILDIDRTAVAVCCRLLVCDIALRVTRYVMPIDGNYSVSLVQCLVRLIDFISEYLTSTKLFCSRSSSSV